MEDSWRVAFSPQREGSGFKFLSPAMIWPACGVYCQAACQWVSGMSWVFIKFTESLQALSATLLVLTFVIYKYQS